MHSRTHVDRITHVSKSKIVDIFKSMAYCETAVPPNI